MLKKLLATLSLLPLSAIAIPSSYVVYDFTHNKVLESRNPNQSRPIASVTKLMTAVVFLENYQRKQCKIAITSQDNDRIKGTDTKLPRNTPIACGELLKAMLIHSDNQAAHALSRVGGNRAAFIKKMNQTARRLGMTSTRFQDSSGLSYGNVSSAMDLVKLSKYAMKKPEIQQLSNSRGSLIAVGNKRFFVQNTNSLVRNEHFDALLNKTGYIKEAGYNLVFVNKQKCNKATIGVISLNNPSSGARSHFTRQKLNQYGCPTLS